MHTLGYEWRGSGKDELMLVPRGPEKRIYSPTDHPDLFMKFSKLSGSAESILGFAKVYGRLVENGTDAEGILGWQQEITHVGRVLTARDFLKGGAKLSTAEVGRVLGDEPDSWNGTRRTSEPLRRRLAQVIESTLNPTPFSFRTNSPSVPQSIAMQALLLPQLIVWDDTRRLFSRQIQPATSLLILIWSQTVEALTGVRDFRKCAYARCSEMIEVSRSTMTGRTARAQFHSDSCRALASRMSRRGGKKTRR